MLYLAHLQVSSSRISAFNSTGKASFTDTLIYTGGVPSGPVFDLLRAGSHLRLGCRFFFRGVLYLALLQVSSSRISAFNSIGKASFTDTLIYTGGVPSGLVFDLLRAGSHLLRSTIVEKDQAASLFWSERTVFPDGIGLLREWLWSVSSVPLCAFQ